MRESISIKCLSVVFLCIVVATSAFAEHLKVDLSVSGQPGGATGFTNWAIVNSATNTHTTTFGSITATIEMTSQSSPMPGWTMAVGVAMI